MNEQNYLRYYVQLVLNHWRLILLTVVIAAAVAATVTAVRADVYEARATVAMLRLRTEVQFDPRIQTVSDYDLTTGNIGSRKEALLALVTSNEVIQRVLEQLPEGLLSAEHGFDDLKGMIEVETVGDLIHLTIQHPDPQAATIIANNWVQIYEKYVNTVYSNTQGAATNNNDVASQEDISNAFQDYEAAQGALEDFIATDSTVTLEREIAIRETLLDSYQQTLAGMQANPVITNQELLASYYNELKQIDIWLADAQSLLNQVESNSGSPSAALNNSISLLLLQSRIFGTDPQRPRETLTMTSELETSSIYLDNRSELPLQINVDNMPAESITPEDVNVLISVLESRRQAAQERIASLESTIQGATDGQVSMPANTPLIQRVEGIENEITSLQSSLEKQRAKRLQLESTRNRMWETYQVLWASRAEEQITTSTPGAEVRVADLAMVPSTPTGSGMLQNILLAAVAAAIFSTGVLIVADWWKGLPESEQRAAKVIATQEDISDSMEDNMPTPLGTSSEQLPNRIS